MRFIFLFLSVIWCVTSKWPQNDAQSAACSCWPRYQSKYRVPPFVISLRGGGGAALLSEPNLHSSESPLLRKVFADGLAQASKTQAKLEATQSAMRKDAAQVCPRNHTPRTPRYQTSCSQPTRRPFDHIPRSPPPQRLPPASCHLQLAPATLRPPHLTLPLPCLCAGLPHRRGPRPPRPRARAARPARPGRGPPARRRRPAAAAARRLEPPAGPAVWWGAGGGRARRGWPRPR
jgi:hypothetical protein